MLTVLNRDSSTPYDNPYEGLLAEGGTSQSPNKALPSSWDIFPVKNQPQAITWLRTMMKTTLRPYGSGSEPVACKHIYIYVLYACKIHVRYFRLGLEQVNKYIF